MGLGKAVFPIPTQRYRCTALCHSGYSWQLFEVILQKSEMSQVLLGQDTVGSYFKLYCTSLS